MRFSRHFQAGGISQIPTLFAHTRLTLLFAMGKSAAKNASKATRQSASERSEFAVVPAFGAGGWCTRVRYVSGGHTCGRGDSETHSRGLTTPPGVWRRVYTRTNACSCFDRASKGTGQ